MAWRVPFGIAHDRHERHDLASLHPMRVGMVPEVGAVPALRLALKQEIRSPKAEEAER